MVKRSEKVAGLVSAAKGLSSTVEKTNAVQSAFERRMSAVEGVASGRRKPSAQLLIDPATCRMWRRHNRLYDKLSVENCADLIDRIAADGQQVPAIVRRLEKDDTHEFEVVAGARRHFAVSHLRAQGKDISYLVEIRALDDLEAFKVSDVENRTRKDISDYERGRDYASALSEFYGGNIGKMSDGIGMNRNTLSAYLYLANLPDEVINAYGDIHDVSVRHGKTLAPKLNDEASRDRIVDEAERIAELQRNARSTGGVDAVDGPTVFKRLLAAAEASRPAHSPVKGQNVDHREIRDDAGDTIVLSQRGRKYLTVKIPVGQLSDKGKVVAAVKKVL